jgi:hypothetical protein
MDEVVEETLTDVTAEKVNAGEMFTALDVTREVQWKHGVFERHDNMKGVVHDQFHNGDMGSYTRTLINIDTIPDPVWLYYDANISNPEDYRSRWLGVKPGEAPNVPAAANINVPAIAQSLDDAANNVQDGDGAVAGAAPAPQGPQGDYDRDKRGRLWISKPLIASLNVNPGDTVYVLVAADSIKITTAAPDPNAAAPYRSYKVDRHGNVAISRVNFNKAGINNPSVDVKNENGEIVITLP